VRFRTLVFLLVCCFTNNTIATDSDNAFTLYLVRHAEKQSEGGGDPGLTGAGKHRAEQLASWLRNKDVTDIWSSEYKRTLGTAEPLLNELGLEVTIYNPRNLVKLSEQLKSKGHNSLVVGHSNTTPELAGLLCQCAIAEMDESEYDRLIVISIGDGKVHAETLKQGDLFKP
jgi:phosphohistidine phosphatase SixA